MTFNDCWGEHKKLIYWWAHKISKIFGGPWRDYLGTIALKIYHTLKTYNPEKGEFGTYFNKYMIDYIVRNFIKNDSEILRLYYADYHSNDDRWKHIKVINYIPKENHPIKNNLSDNFDVVLSEFPSFAECWKFMLKSLNEREQWIITQRYRHNRTLESIGKELGITKERIRQIIVRCLEKIKSHLQEVEDFQSLYE